MTQWGFQIGNIFFNAVDVAAIVMLLAGGIIGACTGMIKSFAHRAGYVIGALCALMFTNLVSPLLVNTFSMPVLVSSLISFVVIFYAGFLLSKLLGALFAKIVDLVRLGVIDNLLGFFWGLVEALILICIIIWLLMSQDFIDMTSLFSGSGFIVPVVQKIVPVAVDVVQSYV